MAKRRKRRARNNPAHRGYSIKKTLTGDVYIEKEGSLISWAKTEAAAKRIIDDLLGKNSPARKGARVRKNVETYWDRVNVIHGRDESDVFVQWTKGKPASHDRTYADRDVKVRRRKADRRRRKMELELERRDRRAREVATGSNPNGIPKSLLGPVIGNRVLAVEYQGGEGKNPKSHWRHDFEKAGAQVIGLKDGSVLLKRGKKPLWKEFD